MKKVAFINGKGGCGKTTGVFNVAGVLAKRGFKVLVIDFDKQKNLTNTLLASYEDADKPLNSVLDFMLGDCTGAECTAKALWESRGGAKPKYHGVDVMCGDVLMEDETILSKVDADKASERLDAFCEDGGYDFVIVDMPPSNLVANRICFRFVDGIVSPFSSDNFAVTGYGDILTMVEDAREFNPALKIYGIYLSKVLGGRGIEQYIKESLSEFDTYIKVEVPYKAKNGAVKIAECIPNKADLAETILFARPISYYKPSSVSCKAFEVLTDEIIARANR